MRGGPAGPWTERDFRIRSHQWTDTAIILDGLQRVFESFP
jgi:hypothetical protein